MKRLFLALFPVFFVVVLKVDAQVNMEKKGQQRYAFADYFNKAYLEYPNIPRGLLESIAYTNTHIRHIKPLEEAPSCIGLPGYHGVMGLVSDGKGYFRNNLSLVESKSHYSAREIVESPEKNILAYAEAFNGLLNTDGPVPTAQFKTRIVPVIIALSELPYKQSNVTQDFALNSHVYSVLSFLNDQSNQNKYTFPEYDLDLKSIFGEENYKVLSAKRITVAGNKINSTDGHVFGGSALPAVACLEYPPAIWDAADASNYSSRGLATITHVTIHTMQGTYAGAISWFKNPLANVSAHYNMRASDGQVTQMVCEIDKAWHVGNSNPYAIGIEHEGYIDDATWYTSITYATSADLVKDICNDNAINRLRTYNGPGTDGLLPLSDGCYKVKGHQHFPAQTHVDPGKYWDWDLFYELINQPFATTTFTACSGSFTDPGGVGNYANDDRGYYLIQPPGATSVTLSFSSFNLETGFDFLYVYDGTSDDAPLLATLNGSSIPANITANSGSMYLKFYADCGTTASGWNASWSCSSGSVACGIPTNLTSTSVTAISALLGWDAVSGSTEYEVRVKANNSQDTWTNMSTNNNYLQVSGLTKGQLYVWQVRTICGPDTSVYVAGNFTTGTLGSSYLTSECSGIFRDAGGNLANYGNNENYTYTISPAGGGTVTLVFSSFDIEANWDKMYIYDGPSSLSPLIGIYTGTTSPGTIVSTGSDLTIRFTSDNATTKPGWNASWTCSGGIPETTIDPLNAWNTGDFTAGFTDVDYSGTGWDSKFYQVLELSANGSYTGNTGQGFLNDEFSTLSGWTNAGGTWVLGSARQTDETNGNTNLYTALNQGNEVYLYHWQMKIGGSGTNRRAGIHFFADDPALSNRGNSYFIYFRVDQNKAQIYDVVANAWTLDTDDTCTVNANEWYDYKVVFNSVSGEIKAYQNDVLVTSWIDPTPLTTANSVSLRTGNADVSYRNFKVYKGRGSTQLITVGELATDYIRSQNPNPGTPAGQIYNLVLDNNDQWSLLDSVFVNVDRSAPDSITGINDGTMADLDTTFDNTRLDANWNTTEDTNSNVSEYGYFIGTMPNDSSIQGYTSVGIDTFMSSTGLSLTVGDTYYITVIAKNGAGLYSQVSSSDGIVVFSAPMALHPSELNLKAEVEGRQVELFWNALDKRYLNYILFRKPQYNPEDQYEMVCRKVRLQGNTNYSCLDEQVNPGQYMYKVVAESDDGTLVSEEIPVSLDGSQQALIYPNPFSDWISVRIRNLNSKDKITGGELCIYDATGKEVQCIQIETEESSISLQSLPSGMYAYRFTAFGMHTEGVQIGVMIKR